MSHASVIPTFSIMISNFEVSFAELSFGFISFSMWDFQGCI